MAKKLDTKETRLLMESFKSYLSESSTFTPYKPSSQELSGMFNYVTETNGRESRVYFLYPDPNGKVTYDQIKKLDKGMTTVEFARDENDAKLRIQDWLKSSDTDINKESYDMDSDDEANRDYHRKINKVLKQDKKRYPCPTCGQKDALDSYQQSKGYQCDDCADRAEGGGY